MPLTALASRFILRQAPWWEPSRYVPLLGMVLGNAISAVTLGSNHVLSVFEYVLRALRFSLTLPHSC